MRIVLPILLLAACSAEPEPERSLYAGSGRDLLCVDGDRIGFITYGASDSNCSVRGTMQRAGERIIIVPDGDQDCRIAATAANGAVQLGARQAACDYYCGPATDFSGRQFRRIDGSPRDAVDLAGDPLC